MVRGATQIIGLASKGTEKKEKDKSCVIVIVIVILIVILILGDRKPGKENKSWFVLSSQYTISTKVTLCNTLVRRMRKSSFGFNDDNGQRRFVSLSLSLPFVLLLKMTGWVKRSLTLLLPVAARLPDSRCSEIQPIRARKRQVTRRKQVESHNAQRVSRFLFPDPYYRRCSTLKRVYAHDLLNRVVPPPPPWIGCFRQSWVGPYGQTFCFVGNDFCERIGVGVNGDIYCSSPALLEPTHNCLDARYQWQYILVF